MNLIFIIAIIMSQVAASPAPQQADMFVGSDACRECHTNEYRAWSETKHASALNKLSEADRSSGKCILCHVTDTAEMLAGSQGQPKFPHVQCEACHGAGRAHSEASKAGNAASARTKPVREASCTRCHNPDSPSYKTFIYAAMTSLAHPVQ